MENNPQNTESGNLVTAEDFYALASMYIFCYKEEEVVREYVTTHHGTRAAQFGLSIDGYDSEDYEYETVERCTETEVTKNSEFEQKLLDTMANMRNPLQLIEFEKAKERVIRSGMNKPGIKNFLEMYEFRKKITLLPQ